MSTLEDRLAGNSSSVPWIPTGAKYDKGECNRDEQIIGVVVDHFTRDNFNQDGLIDVVVLRLDDGSEVAVHCQATVLASQMTSLKPKYGDRIGVKYLGLRTGSGPKPYHDFRVVGDRPDGGPIAWGGKGDPVSDYVDPQKTGVRHEAGTAGSTQDIDDIPFAYTVF